MSGDPDGNPKLSTMKANWTSNLRPATTYVLSQGNYGLGLEKGNDAHEICGSKDIPYLLFRAHRLPCAQETV